MVEELKKLTQNYMRENELSPREFSELAKISETSMHNLLYSKSIGLQVVNKVINTIGYELILKKKEVYVEEKSDSIYIQVVNPDFAIINGKTVIKSMVTGEWLEEGDRLNDAEWEFLRSI